MAEITTVSQNEGSTEGGTYLTISGSGFLDDTVTTPVFKVGGKCLKYSCCTTFGGNL